MEIKKALPEEFIEENKKRNKQYLIGSSFNFLKKHYGLRPCCTHGIIGSMGSGKSSLAKRIAEESACENKVLIWLTEETTGEWQTKMSRNLKNISFIEEKALPKEAFQTIEKFYEFFERAIDEAKPKLVIIDNVTTSFMYSDRAGIKGQDYTARVLTTIPKNKKVSILYVAHTKKEITTNCTRLLTPEDIRGSGQLAIQSEYVYLFHKFTIAQTPYSVIRTAKHRHHDEAHGIFALVWQDGNYSCDRELDWETFKKFFNKMDKL